MSNFSVETMRFLTPNNDEDGKATARAVSNLAVSLDLENTVERVRKNIDWNKSVWAITLKGNSEKIGMFLKSVTNIVEVM